MAMNMRLKIKSRWQRYDINWPRTRHGHKYTKCKMFEAEFMKELSNTDAELKKSVAYKKACKLLTGKLLKICQYVKV